MLSVWGNTGGTNLLASGCDSRQALTLQLGEARKVLSKVACPIALIFNKRRAFSLKLFNNLFGSHSSPALFSLTCLSVRVFFIHFSVALPLLCRRDNRQRCETMQLKKKQLHVHTLKKLILILFQILAHRADWWLRQPGRSAVSFPRTTMGTPVERLAGKIVGVATTVRGLFSCERTQPPIRKTHHTKSIHDLIMTP